MITIENDKFYNVRGDFILTMVNILKALKTQVEKHPEYYHNNEIFLSVIDNYDFIISYLLSLSTQNKSQTKSKSAKSKKTTKEKTVCPEELPDIPTHIKSLLEKMNISIDKKLDENDF